MSPMICLLSLSSWAQATDPPADGSPSDSSEEIIVWGPHAVERARDDIVGQMETLGYRVSRKNDGRIVFRGEETVTLLPTHWQKTNAIMQRNRRIGTGVSGIANFVDTHGMTVLRTWFNQGYETVRYYDNIYSEWLCVPVVSGVVGKNSIAKLPNLVRALPDAKFSCLHRLCELHFEPLDTLVRRGRRPGVTVISIALDVRCVGRHGGRVGRRRGGRLVARIRRACRR